MSSTTSTDLNFDDAKRQCEETVAKALLESLREFVTTQLLTQECGLQLLSEAAFGIDRKIIVAQLLREAADDVERGYRVRKG